MPRIFVALLTVLAVLGPAAGAVADSAPPAEGGIGVRLMDAPADRANDPRALIYIVDHMNPGEVIHRRIQVSNTTAEVVSVSVYEAAAQIESGVFAGAPDRTANDLTSWTSVDRSVVTLDANDAQAVAVTIAVPQNAVDGERYGIVWAEIRSVPASADAVTVVNRVGIRVYLSVGTGAEPLSAMHIDSLLAGRNHDGQPVVTAQVRNSGARALDIGGQLSLTDGPGGLNGGPFPVRVPTTLGPGETGHVTATLDASLPAGPWKAHLELKSGPLTETADATLTFPETPGTATAPITPQSNAGILWLSIGLGLAALLLLAVLLVRNRRRQNSDAGIPES
ncbi:hypothetical protein SAMN04489740_3847 [Arthrobacter alpinus]|uniref:Peptidase n=1 Tax=Arthrobacter alpinus TaxID=656366 RepID=A0A1H5NMR5_9MICC|nr:peptidase [Arthrobacter alpinus]SEF02724.1 hypothetical protein SAMN04489740_3847 [Arthrobacter alpinus]